MAELWAPFCDKLKNAGYTLKDMEYCSDDLFLAIAEELGAFSPLQISSLLSYWHRRKRAGTLSDQSSLVGHQAPPAPMSKREADGKPAPAYPAATVRQAAQRLLQRVGGGAASGPALTVQDVVGVEAPASNWLAFRACVSRQQQRQQHGHERTTGDPVSVLWKLCGPETLARMERACAASRVFELSCADDTDALCESGVVLFDGDLATTLGANAVTPALVRQRLTEDGWALVAFDVAAGRSREVTLEEVGNLGHFSMAQCAEMLQEAGYDSLSVPSAGAIVVCDATQLVPRNVVFVGVSATTTSTSTSATASPNTTAANANHSSPRRLEYSTAAAAAGVAASPSPSAAAGQPQQRHPHQQREEGGRLLALTQQDASTTATTAPAPAAAAAPTTKCDVHPQKEVEFWCPTEKRLLCSHCLYYDGYSRENCMPIEVGARQEVPRLERWVTNAATFAKEVQGVVQLFADAQADIARQEDKVSTGIAQQFEQVRRRLDALEADMLHEVRDQSRTRRQDVEAATHDVTGTVERVGALLAEVEAPMRLYRASGSAAGVATCVQLLRGVQRAFADWPVVDIAPYAVPQPLGGFLAEVEAALGHVPKVSVMPGKVELPEAIDVNFLRTDAE